MNKGLKHVLTRIAPPIIFYIIASAWACLNLNQNEAMATIPIFAILTMIALIFTGGYTSFPETE